MTLYLTEIRRLPHLGKLRLTWNDDHSADFPFDYVRGYCPCATCQGHGATEIKFQAPATPVKPSMIEEVGNYGISIAWSDGHSTGIYRFDFLRQICPCEDCRSQRETD